MKAQTAIEYILLISGVIMLVVILLLLVRGNVFESANSSISNATRGIWDVLRGV